MACLDGMNIHGEGAGRGHGRGDLARDVAALADAGEDHPPLSRTDEGDRFAEAKPEFAVECRCKLSEAAELGLKGPLRRLKPCVGTSLAQLAQFQQLEQSINTGQDISAIRGDLDKLALANAGTNPTSNT